MEELWEVAVNLVQHGMMVEHDLARLYAGALDAALKDWEESPDGENKLQILANAMGYYYLMVRHIDRENQVIYPYARRSLSQETLQRLNKELENDTETFKNRKKSKPRRGSQTAFSRFSFLSDDFRNVISTVNRSASVKIYSLPL